MGCTGYIPKVMDEEHNSKKQERMKNNSQIKQERMKNNSQIKH